MHVFVSMCVCECVYPQYGSPSVCRRAASCSPLISATQPHTLTGAHKHSRMHTFYLLSLCPPVCRHTFVWMSFCAHPRKAHQSQSSAFLLSRCLPVYLSVLQTFAHDGGGGGAGGDSLMCHLASPAETPPSAKWQGHKMAAARWLWQNGSWEVYGNLVTKGSFHPSCIHVWKREKSKEGGRIKSYRPPPPPRVRGTDRSVAAVHKDYSAGPGLLENSGVGGGWRNVCVCICVCACGWVGERTCVRGGH